MEHSGDGRRPWNPRLTAAFVLAVVVVAAVVSFALSPRRAPPLAPAPTEHAVSVTALQVPPTDLSLLWFRDSSDASAFVLRAVDWSGRVLGRMSVSCMACGVLASPDGQRLLIGSQSAPGMSSNLDRVFDVAGKLLAVVDGFQAMWADDSRHLCSLRTPPGYSASSNASTVELALDDVSTGDTRLVGEFTTFLPASAGAWTLVSCSAKADRAVADFVGGGVRALRVVQPSTGRILLSGDDVTGDCGCPVSSVAVSGDGTLAAENLSQTGGITEIDLLTGQQVRMGGSWVGRGPINSLSWNGREAVTPLGVFSFPQGVSVWQAPLPAFILPSGSEPLGNELLISLWVSSAAAGQPLVVRADGSAVTLPGSYLSQPPLPY